MVPAQAHEPNAARRAAEYGLVWIDVDKSSYHQLSQSEIASDNPCSQQLSGSVRFLDDRVDRSNGEYAIKQAS